MPMPHFPPRHRRRPFAAGFPAHLWMEAASRKKRKPGKDLDDGGVPVEPDRPRNLTGGAAAELEFRDQ